VVVVRVLQVDYDLSAEDIQYQMYCEMLLYRPTCTRFPPPPSVVAGQVCVCAPVYPYLALISSNSYLALI
jgi:hypothetical protein